MRVPYIKPRPVRGQQSSRTDRSSALSNTISHDASLPRILRGWIAKPWPFDGWQWLVFNSQVTRNTRKSLIVCRKPKYGIEMTFPSKNVLDGSLCFADTFHAAGAKGSEWTLVSTSALSRGKVAWSTSFNLIHDRKIRVLIKVAKGVPGQEDVLSATL